MNNIIFFIISQKCLHAANCGGDLSADRGSFTSPEWGFSPIYPNYQNCTWTKTCDGVIKLTVKNFTIEEAEGCG